MGGNDEADAGSQLVWVAATDRHELALDLGDGPAAKGRLRARSAGGKGKVLRSVPKVARDSATGEQLRSLRDALARHEQSCAETVERWMLGSLPVPTDVLVGVWDDPAWQRPLRDAVVTTATAEGTVDPGGATGFLRAVDGERGLGIVDLDGDTGWLRDAVVVIPHPVMLADLDELREFAVELGIEQGLLQLLRETHPKPADTEVGTTSLSTWADGHFAELRHATARAAAAGFRVRGGYATCRAVDDGVLTDARFWLGADSPDADAWTGDLVWVGGDERARPLGDVGPVAWSEGCRMASLIYAGRVTGDSETS